MTPRVTWVRVRVRARARAELRVEVRVEVRVRVRVRVSAPRVTLRYRGLDEACAQAVGVPGSSSSSSENGSIRPLVCRVCSSCWCT